MSVDSNPYVGPRAFRRGETLYGRDYEALELVDLLIAERVVLLYAPSGAGKSSLIEARLKPQLDEKEGFRILPTLRVGQLPAAGADLPDGANPYLLSSLMILEEELAPGSCVDLEKLAPVGLGTYLEQFEERMREQWKDRRLYELLIFDQLEEVFTAGCQDESAEKARQEFFREVGVALRQRHRWAIFAMREDYIAGLDPYRHAVPTRFANTFRLELLKRDRAAEAIQGPVRELGVEITDQAVGKLVAELSRVRTQGPGGAQEHLGLYVEPVQLQVVCRRLWQNLQRSGELEKTHRIEEPLVDGALGEVDKALGDYYADTVSEVAAANAVPERVVRGWFERRLITRSGIRQQVQEGPAGAGADQRILKALEDAFLVRGVKRRGVTWYELAHDRLIQPLLNDNVHWEMRHLSLLQRRSEQWDREKRPDTLLVRGIELKEVERWAAAHRDRLSGIDRQYLEACRRSRRQLFWGRLAFFAVVALGLLLLQQHFRFHEEKVRRRELEELNQMLGLAKDTSEEEARAAAAEARRNRLTYLPHAVVLEAQAALRQHDHARGALLARQAYRFQRRFLDPEDPDAAAVETDKLITNTALHDVLDMALGEPYFSHVFRGHTGVVRSVAFSPDGTLLASAGSDHEVRVWRLRRPYALEPAVRLSGHDQTIRSVAFSPDGKWLATGSSDGKVRLWPIAGDAVFGQVVELAGHLRHVRAVRFHPRLSPPLLASASNDGTIRIWRLEPTSGRWLSAGELRGHEAEVRALAFSPNGDRLASCGSDGTVLVWDMAAVVAGTSLPPRALDTELWRRGEGEGQEIRAVAFDPEGRWLAAAGPVPPAPDVEASGPDEGSAISGEPNLYGWGVTLFDLSGEAQEPRILHHRHKVRALEFAGTGQLVGSTAAGEVVIWHLAEGKATILAGHRGWVFHVAAYGRFLASAGEDGTVRLWERNVTAGVRSVSWQMGAEVRAIAPSPVVAPDGQRVAIALADGRIEIRRLSESNGELGLEHRLRAPPESRPGPNPEIRAVSFEASGRFLASASSDFTIRLWDMEQPEQPPRILHTSDTGMWAVAFPHAARSDGWLLAAGGYDRQVRVWELGREALVDEPRLVAGPLASGLEANAAVRSLAMSSDGRWLVAATWSDGKDNTPQSGRVRRWDLESLAEGGRPPFVDLPFDDQRGLKIRVSQQAFSSVAFSPDDQLLAAGSWDGTVKVWQTAHLELRKPAEFDGGRGDVAAIAFGPGGRLLASGHRWGEVLVWDVRDPELEPITLTGHAEWVFAVAFSPDGRHLLSGGRDGTVRSWQITRALADRVCELAGRNLSREEWQSFVGNEIKYQCTCPELGPGYEAPPCEDE